MNITGGIYNGRKVQAPDEKITRPTLSKVRMSVFNSLYSEFSTFENKTFLDMFGGSGIMGLEALSRGFKSVTVFEKNRQSAEIIKNNYKTLGLKPNLMIGDSLKLIQKITDNFDVIYIDPPYTSGVYEQCLTKIHNANIIILEHSAEVGTTGYNIIKQKKYGDTYITFLKKELN